MAGLDPLRGDACAGRCRSARRAAPTRSSAWPTWSARRCASATCVCARVVPGGGRLRRRASAARSLWTKQRRRHRRGRRRRRAGVRRRRHRPHHRLAHADSGDVAWTSEALHVPRPERARGWSAQSVVVRRRRGHAALVLARQGRAACCACPPTARRSSAPPVVRRRHCWSSSTARAAACSRFRARTEAPAALDGLRR